MDAAVFDLDKTLEKVKAAAAGEKITGDAAENIKSWLTEDRYAEYASCIVADIDAGNWQTLDDVFWTVIPFGTGGRRGRMHPFGSNAINDRTIGESAQGLADYVRQFTGKSAGLSCGIAYDTRHRSRHFAELCAGIMVANGFKVYFLDEYRSTPELSYLVRYKECDCGIMVTASHNPPSDNAVKVYWSTGGQLVPPHDTNVIKCVEKVDAIQSTEFNAALDAGDVEICTDELDKGLLAEHKQQSFAGPRDLKLLYSPLHGVGEFNVLAALNEVGFQDVKVFELHRKPDGDFPNVPDNTSNPENAAVFDKMIEEANQKGYDLCLATDPDCDRMGAAARLTLSSDQWATLNGNQLCAIMGDYVLGQHKRNGTVPDGGFMITTLVTTPLVNKIAESYGVISYSNNLVGFKWIGDAIDRKGPDQFLYGTEESHGFMVGQYCRDKDGAVACMLMAECAALLKSQGKSLHERMDELYLQHGYHADYVLNVRMEGSNGMKKMIELMSSLRSNPPEEFGGMKVIATRDYGNGTRTTADGDRQPFDGPEGNMVIFELETPGYSVAVRPSGTEPKIKCYLFAYEAPEAISDLTATRSSVKQNVDAICEDLKKLSN